MNKYNIFDKVFHHKSFLYWQNLKMLPRQLKWAKQRVTKGYCRSDWKNILKEMATHLRNAGIEEIADEKYSHMADSKAKIREQNKWRKEELHKFCELFEKYYFDLWD